MIYLVSIFSFILDGLLSNFLPYTFNNISSFTCLFTIVSLVIIFPFFNNDIRKYLLYSFIFGLLYDIFYTDTLLFNAVVFTIIAYIISFIYAYFVNNIYNALAISIIVIALYTTITYLLLGILNYLNFDFIYLFYKIIKSIIINVVYIIIIFPLLNVLANKFKIRKLI